MDKNELINRTRKFDLDFLTKESNELTAIFAATLITLNKQNLKSSNLKS